MEDWMELMLFINRSPTSGIYANLGKFNLPNPMAIFDIRYLAILFF